MIRFVSPEWLILIPVIALAAWYRPAWGLLRPLRAGALLLVVLLMTGPEIRRADGGLDLWVLADRSASCSDHLEPRLSEMYGLIEAERGRDDRLFWIDYADVTEPAIEGDPGRRIFTGNRKSTRLGPAIQHTISNLKEDRAARVLVLTDGYSTEPIEDATQRLVDQQVPLDYRLSAPPSGIDYRVIELDLPVRTPCNEPFLMDARIEGQSDGMIPWSLVRNGEACGEGVVEVRGGRGIVRLSQRLEQAGAHCFEIRLHPPGKDAFPANNRAVRWVEAVGKPRILLITPYEQDPLIALLQEQGIEVDLSLDGNGLHPGRLSGARAVVLHNIPASRIPPDTMNAFDFYVRQQGGGLMMVGGRNSFGSGGYFNSPVDALLPVDLELKQEHRKGEVAMAIVLDRSGSMAASVPRGQTKMQLANEGAARAVELLGPSDEVCIFAVDSSPHRIVPLTSIRDERESIMQRARSIHSMGGGIFVYTGLHAAWQELRASLSVKKHIILFADAADAEEPGNYIQLLQEITAAGATVSVIGMGSESDCDAALLKSVAEKGGGRIFFNDDPETLPSLFAQETVAISRSAFVTDPVAYRPMAGWAELAAQALQWPADVDAYNVTYLRPDATAAAVSGDEYESPLLAFWQCGVGRTAALTLPLAGEYSSRIRNWPQYGDYMRTVTRWIMSRDLPPGLGLRLSRQGSTIRVDLGYGPDWESRIAASAPVLLTVDAGGKNIDQHAWHRLDPGHYKVDVPVEEAGAIRGVVQVGGYAVPFGPISVGQEIEWMFDARALSDLRQASARSGGVERNDLGSIWKSARRAEFLSVRPHIICPLLILILADALLTRLGIHPFRRPARRRTSGTAPPPVLVPETVRAPSPAPAPAKPTPDEPPSPVPIPERTPAPPPAAPTHDRKSRFDRARRRGT